MRRNLIASPAFGLLLLVWIGSSGCRSPAGVDRVGWERTFRELGVDAIEDGEPSEASRAILDRHDLIDGFDGDPETALLELHSIACRERSIDHLFALSELSFLEARRTGGPGGRARYLACAAYAYLFLFDDGFRGPLEPLDPRVRLAADLYDAALTEAFRDEAGDVALRAGTHELPFGTLEIRVDPAGYERYAEVERLLPAADYRLRGLRVRNRVRGLGAALIAVAPLPPDQKTPIADRSSVKTYRPATAVLRLSSFPGPLERWTLSGTVEIHDPRVARAVEIAGGRVPLEADLSAPIARTLEGSRLWSFGLAGLLSGDVEGFIPGLYMIGPHAPGKVPIVLVHGTASSPARWADMMNSLVAFPALRERFEVWLFLYTTGNPIAYSASFLRDEIRRVVAELDPEGTDPDLKRMVVIGHSQGGLLARLAASDSGTIVWDQLLATGLDPERVSPEDRELLRKMAIFERVPSISRVVFVATPHGGSFLADRWYSRIGSALISIPGSLVTLGKDLLGADRTLSEELGSRIPTSLDNMSTRSKFVTTLRMIPLHPEVKVHSIVAVEGSGPVEEGNDGVVEYVSAHLPGTESESVVRSGHSCQSHPATVMEVRRILVEHLAEGETGPTLETEQAIETDAPRRGGVPRKRARLRRRSLRASTRARSLPRP